MIDELQQEIYDLKDVVSDLQNQLKTYVLETDFLTSNEVMNWLKISRPTLHRWKEKGILTAYNVGGKILFKKSEILAMVEDSKMVA